MTWTQPVCEARFRQMYPGREPVRVLLEEDELDPCCYCRTPNVRLDPKTVPYPRTED